MTNPYSAATFGVGTTTPGTTTPGTTTTVTPPQPDAAETCNLLVAQVIATAVDNVTGTVRQFIVVGTSVGCDHVEVRVTNTSGQSVGASTPTSGGSWRLSFQVATDKVGSEWRCGSRVVVTVLCLTKANCASSATLVLQCPPGGGAKGSSGSVVPVQPGRVPVGWYRGVTIDTVDPSARSGTVGSLLGALASAGIGADALLSTFSRCDTAEFGHVVRYLRATILLRPMRAEGILFHLDLIRSVNTDSLAQWAQLAEEVASGFEISAASAKFVQAERVELLLHTSMIRRLGWHPQTAPETRERSTPHLRALMRLAESVQSLVEDDPGLGLLLHTINRYGSVPESYKSILSARRAIGHMAEAGFDASYLTGEGRTVAESGASTLSDPALWHETLQTLIRRVIGSRTTRGEITIAEDPHLIFHELRKDYSSFRASRDKDAAIRIINRLLQVLELPETATNGNVSSVADSDVAALVQELLAVRAIIHPSQGQHARPYLLRAMRSEKRVPELLFDNERLSCCLFKPAGLFHGELTRLLIDPATPLLEFWLEPYQEFLGLATLYPGRNAAGQRTMLVDTVDYDDRLLEFRGYSATMEFVLNSIILDAHAAKAEAVVIFAAPYGKASSFANFVRRMSGRSSNMRYHGQYYFESVDPSDQALASCPTGAHHYTVAFGYNQPMRGLIDFGYSLVAPGSVDKLYAAGSGVIEIDVRGYLMEKHLLSNAHSPQQHRATEELIHVKTEHEVAELARREADLLADLVRDVGEIIEEPRVQLVSELSADILRQLLELEAEAFPEELKYMSRDFSERLAYKDARILAVFASDSLAAFALMYAAPRAPFDGMYLDDLAVSMTFQGKGLGTHLIRACSRFGHLRGYHGMHVLARGSDPQDHLIAFYQKRGFVLVGALGGSALLHKRFSLLDASNHSALDQIVETATLKLQRVIPDARLSFHESVSEDLIGIIKELERGFPQSERYSDRALRKRFNYQDVCATIVHAGDTALGFALTYHDPILPRHGYFFDSMSLRPEYRARGLGDVIMRVCLSIPTVGPYTRAILFCNKTTPDGLDLQRFYSKFGGTVVSHHGSRIRMLLNLDGPPLHAFTNHTSASHQSGSRLGQTEAELSPDQGEWEAVAG